MKMYKATNLRELSEFSNSKKQLAVFERMEPPGAKEFTEKLLRSSLKSEGIVHKEKAAQDIRHLLQSHIPQKLQSTPFYNEWVTDMAEICKAFCDTLSDVAIRFRLGSVRGCKRYHTDNVSMRLLVTYQGTGTEWLPDEVADRQAYADGKSNEQIVRDASAIQFMNPWDIAIFKGGSDGVLHRTPDTAIERPSILLRLDPVPSEELYSG